MGVNARSVYYRQLHCRVRALAELVKHDYHYKNTFSHPDSQFSSWVILACALRLDQIFQHYLQHGKHDRSHLSILLVYLHTDLPQGHHTCHYAADVV